MFESFVEVLFDIISHINSPADRVLRAAVRPAFFIFFKAVTYRHAMNATSNSRGRWSCVRVVTKACDCLRELALTYPKLLTKSLGHLYKYLT